MAPEQKYQRMVGLHLTRHGTCRIHRIIQLPQTDWRRQRLVPRGQDHVQVGEVRPTAASSHELPEPDALQPDRNRDPACEVPFLQAMGEYFDYRLKGVEFQNMDDSRQKRVGPSTDWTSLPVYPDGPAGVCAVLQVSPPPSMPMQM